MKDKESHCMANFASIVPKTLLCFLKKKKNIDEFNYLQFLNDDNEPLQTESNKVVIELSGVKFWYAFEITHMILDQIALHSVNYHY